MRSFNILPNNPHWWEKGRKRSTSKQRQINQKNAKCMGKRAKRVYSYVITRDVQSVPIAWVVKEKRTDHEKAKKHDDKIEKRKHINAK